LNKRGRKTGERRRRRRKKGGVFFVEKRKKRRTIALFNPDRATNRHVLSSFKKVPVFFLSLSELRSVRERERVGREEKKKKNCSEHHHHHENQQEKNERANSIFFSFSHFSVIVVGCACRICSYPTRRWRALTRIFLLSFCEPPRFFFFVAFYFLLSSYVRTYFFFLTHRSFESLEIHKKKENHSYYVSTLIFCHIL